MSKERKVPTLFVLEGSIRLFGKSMLQLHTSITPTEWKLIIEETIQYYNYLKALKEVGMPRLDEPWTENDEQFLTGLGTNISRMRNIDPILVARHDQEKLLSAYKAKMEVGSKQFKEEMKLIHDQLASTALNITLVSDL